MSVSQKDIARMLGVTRVTVTRALGESPLVSAETRAQVRALCNELGYHPHYSSRSLKSAQTKVISIMRYDIKLTDLHSRWVSFLQREAQKAGYMIRLDPVTSFDRVYGEGSADGFIIFDDSIYNPSRVAEKVLCSAVPMVILDCKLSDFPINSVTSDNDGGMRLAVQHLIQQGHRKILYFGVTRWGVGQERFTAFTDEMSNHSLRIDDSLYISQERWAEDTEEAEREEAQLMRAVKSGVTAVAAASDLYAAGAIRILRKNGLVVPNDISVIGYDNSLLSRAYNPSLSTVVQDVESASKAAIDMLLNRIKTNEAISGKIIPSRLIVRESTGPMSK